MAVPVVDSHQHFWDVGRFEYPWMTPQRAALRRNILPADLKPLIAQAAVDRTVVVQAHQSREESRWLLELAEANEFVAGAVVWVDLVSPQLGRDLDELQPHPKFRGVRHLIEDEPDDAWMLRADVLNGLAELERRAIPFDLCIKPRHLKYVPRLRDRCPRLKLVVDHLAKPPIAAGRADEWERDFASVARLPNIWCKLSGLVTEADWNRWTPDELKPYVDLAVRQFGYDRVMFGTDWPVCTLAGSYQQVVEALRYALGPLSEADAAKVWGGNAAAFYQLRA